MKNKTLFKALIVFSFLLLGTIGQGQAQSVSSVGVTVGDSFNFKVTKNDFTAVQTKAYVAQLLDYYNVSALTVNSNYDFSSIIETLNETMVPSVGDIIGFTVTQLPSNDAVSGKLNFTYGTTTEEMTTGFIIGTPVVFTDWAFWNTTVNELNNYATDLGGFIDASVQQDTNVFNFSVTITFTTVPDELSQNGFTSLIASLDGSYNKSTGILISESFKIDLKSSS